MIDDEMMEFQVSHDMDDWSHAVKVMAYDLGEAVDEYVRIAKEQQGESASLPPRLYVRLKGDDQVYEVATETEWEETEEDLAAVQDVDTIEEIEEEDE